MHLIHHSSLTLLYIVRSLSSPQGRIAQAGNRKCGSSWEPAGGRGMPAVESYQLCWSQNCAPDTLKSPELYVHPQTLRAWCSQMLVCPHPSSGEPLGSTYAFQDLRTDRSRQNRALSSEASQYHLAAISKPTLIWGLSFLILKPYKEHANSSLGAKYRNWQIVG